MVNTYLGLGTYLSYLRLICSDNFADLNLATMPVLSKPILFLLILEREKWEYVEDALGQAFTLGIHKEEVCFSNFRYKQ